MQEKTLSSNYLFTFIKFILFLLIFCFAFSFTKFFIKEVRLEKDINFNILSLSFLSCFLFYTFFVDLNNLYSKIQKFFFHSNVFSLVVPSFLIVLGLGFFLIPKIFNLNFDKNLFLFLGGFILISHLIFIARDLKKGSFSGFINYLFIFSILYIINLLIFSIYLNIAFKIDLAKILVEGSKGGAFLIKNLFSQISR